MPPEVLPMLERIAVHEAGHAITAANFQANVLMVLPSHWKRQAFARLRSTRRLRRHLSMIFASYMRLGRRERNWCTATIRRKGRRET